MKPINEYKDAHKDIISCFTRIDETYVWSASTDGKIGIWSTTDPKTRAIQGFTPGKVSRQLMANRSSSTRSMLCNSVRLSPPVAQNPLTRIASVDDTTSTSKISISHSTRKAKTKSVNLLSRSYTTKLPKDFHFI